MILANNTTSTLLAGHPIYRQTFWVHSKLLVSMKNTAPQMKAEKTA